MTPGVSDLADHLGYWLRLVSNQVSHAFAAKIEARGVTVAEWVVLRKLYDEDETAPGSIASALGMTRGAISKLADRLVDKKLISRKSFADDLRQQRLSLTAKGRALVPVLAAEADRNDRDFFGRLKEPDRMLLLGMLQELAKSLDSNTSPVD
jgi:DNA-binding MarR family transcriptional regulator